MKITVLQVLPSLHSGGVERGAIEIANALVEKGHKAIVLSAGGKMVNLLHKDVTHIVNKNIASRNPLKFMSNAKTITQITKDYAVDIVHARSRAPAWGCYFSCKKTKIPFITTFHGCYNFNNFIKKYYNSVMAKSDHVIAVSQFIKDHILTNYHKEESKITVINRGIDYTYFSKNAITQNRILTIAKDWNIENFKQNKSIIMVPARMAKWKGHLFLIDALKLLDRKDFICLLVGDDGKNPRYVSELRSKISSLDLGDSIKIMPFIQDLQAAYMLIDFIICPSLEPEAFGRSVIEGAAMEKIVIGTKLGAVTYNIIDGETGFLVDSKDVVSFARKISEVLDMSKEAKEDMGKAASKFVRSKFSKEKMCKETLEVYTSIMNDKK